MKNVLIVEDESLVALEISSFVNEQGFTTCCIASSAQKAYNIIEKQSVDLILMDIKIKGSIDGIECAKEIRKRRDIPLIYISAFSDDKTLERAIETEPSAYLTKPFNRKELKVAMKIATKDKSDKLRVGNIIFDKEFSYDSKNSDLIMLGEVVHLTKQEKLLLSLLVGMKNNIVDIYELENYIWPDKQSNENTRRALVGRLRSKLKYKFLETIHSVGYKISI